MIRVINIVFRNVEFVILLTVWMSIMAYPQSRVFDTKHNLTAIGPGTIKAATEKNTCLFCHTPHAPRATTQLWNHALSTATYDLYTSDYLTSLNYATPVQPNAQSKLCLSCHDGTVAIGAVYNNRGGTSIAMANGVTTMPATSSSNLGTSLMNDHPVGYIYDNTKDPELVGRSWPWQTSIKLDPDQSNGTVECQTCHDPHDNTNPPFLRMGNTNASLCIFCHSKTEWSNSVHKTSTQLFVKTDSTTTTVGEWACRSCHKSHGGGGIPYLLNLAEENDCFTSGCHGTNATGVNTKNIQSELNKLYKHPIDKVSGKHKNPDDHTSLNVPNRHSECPDCHNSHRAQKGLHVLQSNSISNVLKGVSGVTPSFAAEWTQPTIFSTINPVVQENQICFKCHSYYAFGVAIEGVTTIEGPSGQNITDQGMEFNPANHSAHPVVVSTNNQTGSLSPKSLMATQMTTTWNNVGSQTMYCSDCHGNNDQTSATAPQGPHGSNAKFILTGAGKYWPTNRLDSLWTLDDIRYNRNNWSTDLFCANCHTMYNGLSFLNNAHDTNKHKDMNMRCITCHVVVPHGSQRSRLIGYASDVAPYNYIGPGFDQLMIIGFQKAAISTGYTVSSCSTNNPACHGVQTQVYEK
ncbi:MAG: cytochrome c3 family protein [Bacteroidota bacterium]